MPSRCANPQAGAEQFGNSFMKILVNWPALIFGGSFRFLDALGLAFAAPVLPCCQVTSAASNGVNSEWRQVSIA